MADPQEPEKCDVESYACLEVNEQSQAELEGDDANIPEAELLEEKAAINIENMNTSEDPVSDDNVYSCLTCAREYKTLRRYNEHMKVQHAKGVGNTCDVCGNKFLKLRGTKPLAIHTSVCLACSKASKKMEKCEGTRHECELCGKRFQRNSLLIIHMRVHSGERPFSCQVCGRAFKEAGQLKRHMRGHTGEQPHMCELCGKKFAEKGNLLRHQQRIHGGKVNSSNIFVQGCSDPKMQTSVYETNISACSTDASYSRKEQRCICEVCGKELANSTSLKQHIRTHTGERPFVCNICGKSFTVEVTLIRHKRIHTGERPYVCPQCGGRFKERSNLTSHLRTHSGKKPFMCGVCGDAFAQLGTLTRHKKLVHGREKPQSDETEHSEGTVLIDSL